MLQDSKQPQRAPEIAAPQAENAEKARQTLKDRERQLQAQRAEWHQQKYQQNRSELLAAAQAAERTPFGSSRSKLSRWVTMPLKYAEQGADYHGSAAQQTGSGFPFEIIT